MVADYYVLHRRRLNVPELYSLTGQFRYTGGFNIAGLLAWVIGGGVAAWYSQYAFVVGFPLGFVAYLILTRLLVLPYHPQAEITSRHSRAYLATSEGLSWAYLGDGRFRRAAPGEEGAVDREDL
jgi:nucleobase:cation symporter-1, NCS1 family